MPITNLKNISINERTTINGDTYFVIKDNDQNQVYFCFQNKLKEGWSELVRLYENIKESKEITSQSNLSLVSPFPRKGEFQVELEYIEHERGNKVIGLWTFLENDFIV